MFIPTLEVMRDSYIRDQIKTRGWKLSKDTVETLEKEFSEGIKKEVST